MIHKLRLNMSETLRHLNIQDFRLVLPQSQCTEIITWKNFLQNEDIFRLAIALIVIAVI